MCNYYKAPNEARIRNVSPNPREAEKYNYTRAQAPSKEDLIKRCDTLRAEEALTRSFEFVL
jgi:hypothetical protein